MIKRYFIVGLGMIGSSYAKKLSSLGYLVDGYDIDPLTVKKAIKLGYIKNGSLTALKNADAVILTLYPKANISFVKDNLNSLKTVKYLTDVSGVKEHLVKEIENLIGKDTLYCSHHPMAGSEKSGIDACRPEIFEGANFLIIKGKTTKAESLLFLKDLAFKLKFNKPIIIDSETHDAMISFTSQLPHMIASALVNSDIYVNASKFTGDSYKDLTRIANINEALWIELYSSNKNNLLKDMERFKDNFNKLYEAFEKDDLTLLKSLLIKAKEKRKSYDKDDKS